MYNAVSYLVQGRNTATKLLLQKNARKLPSFKHRYPRPETLALPGTTFAIPLVSCSQKSAVPLFLFPESLQFPSPTETSERIDFRGLTHCYSGASHFQVKIPKLLLQLS